MTSPSSNLITDVRIRRMDRSAMMLNDANPFRKFLSPIGVVAFLTIFLLADSTCVATDFDPDHHAEYCGCGTKCRREKCCCGPSESVAVTSGAESSQTLPAPNEVMTFRNFLCRMLAPCGNDADAPGSRVFRSCVHVAAVSVESSLLTNVSCRYVPDDSGLSIPEVPVSGVDRPPEFLA